MSIHETRIPWLGETSELEPVIVTGRDYESARDMIRLPEDYFPKGSIVLSVGEGFSGFSKHLHEKKEVFSVAVDPLYELGQELHVENISELRDVLKKNYGGSVIYSSRYQKNVGFTFPDSSRSVAASVYKLPFRNESLDFVVANQVVQYVDAAKAVPEMTSKIRKDGELRIGANIAHALPDQDKLLPYKIHFDPATNDYFEEESLGVTEMFDWLVKQEELSAYIMMSSYPRTDHNKQVQGLYYAPILMIRKDDKTPQVQTISQEEIENYDAKNGARWKELYPHLGNIYRIEKNPRVQGSGLIHDYFTISPA